MKNRSAFTLVELVIVISIIVLLIGLLIPVLGSVQRKVRIAQVTVEVQSLSAALESFKSKYGHYPPSRITLYSSGSVNPPTGWFTDPQSMQKIRQFWPQFNFTMGGGFPFPPGKTTITLDGPECLVFFLGGARDIDGTFIGFSNNPAKPFSPLGNSRVPRFFDFRQDRLSDIDNDKNPEYRDVFPGQTMPYIYLSSRYSVNDLDQDGDLNTTNDRWMQNIYTQGTGSNSFWNPQTFQIVSPGPDSIYGPGGLYEPKSADVDLIGNREAERDNITNFSNGTLVK